MDRRLKLDLFRHRIKIGKAHLRNSKLRNFKILDSRKENKSKRKKNDEDKRERENERPNEETKMK